MKFLKILITAIAVLIVAGVTTSYVALKGSLPQIDGSLPLSGLSNEVKVERDENGIPTFTGTNREDVARATGFIHAQDRLFQMDVLRRIAAGELAELLGPTVLDQDISRRLFRMRSRLHNQLAHLPKEQHDLLNAYAEGVNQGIGSFPVLPFEYLLLGERPRAWMPEDSLLVLTTMFFGLSDPHGQRDRILAAMQDNLPSSVVSFLNPPGTVWDAPLIGAPILPTQSIPSASTYDLRQITGSNFPSDSTHSENPILLGSNNWAVSGSHVQGGGALVAGDVHLNYGVPHILYRARIIVTEPDEARDVSGATIPGIPFVLFGSNKNIAWALTTPYGDWTDLVRLELDQNNSNRYRVPEGWEEIKVINEAIHIRGQGDKNIAIRETRWGPVEEDGAGRAQAVHWLGIVPGAIDIGFIAVETATTAHEAISRAQVSGLPPQNFTVGDKTGHIGWTIAGRIPQRTQFDPDLPTSWATGSSWTGFLSPEEYPSVTNPENGRIWTANARTVNGEDLKRVGTGTYALGARAKQIRDDLLALDQATPEDMFAIQLDDRALFLERWQKLLLSILDTNALLGHPLRVEAKALIANWKERADQRSVGYRIVNEWRNRLHDLVFKAILSPCKLKNPDCTISQRTFQSEAPLWELVTQQPLHLLNPHYSTWNDLFLKTFDQILSDLDSQSGGLKVRTWGEANSLKMQHPLTKALPFLSNWLDMPAAPQSGDTNMPRVQQSTKGAAERFAVSPGQESEGYFVMPGGQSGHPLSPWYQNFQEDWMADKATPFLPSASEHSLKLTPLSISEPSG